MVVLRGFFMIASRHLAMQRRCLMFAVAPLFLLASCARESDSYVEPALSDTGVVGDTLDRELSTSDGRTRSYHLYVPTSLGSGPVPLLIALHGGTGSGTQFQRQSEFDVLAEREGFLVVFPDGVGIGRDESRLRTWNGGYCCGAAARRNVDDVAFIDALIDTIGVDYELDPNRVFVVGHSNGGIMAYRLACELSEQIAAIGLQAGSLGVDECNPTQPVSVIHLHGTADENHPIEGGVGDKSISDTSFNSATYSVETVAAAMNCDPPTESVVDDPEGTRTSWQCDGETEVQLVAVTDAPHQWMADASVAILEFLFAHPRR